MIQSKDFYIYLSSNKSETFNPTCFTVALPYTISFSREFEVALIKVIIPVTWYNLKEDAYIKWGIGSSNVETINIQAGLYTSAKEFIDKLNRGILQVVEMESFPSFDVPSLKYIESENKCTIHFPIHNRDEDWFFRLSTNLEKVLGIKSTSKNDHQSEEDCPPSANQINVPSCESAVDLSGNVNLIAISTPLIEESVVGLTLEPILDTVAPPEVLVYGTAISKTFFPRRYHRLNPSSYQEIKSITIKIKDITGEEIQMIGGSTSVWLHFRPVQPQQGVQNTRDGSLLH